MVDEDDSSLIEQLRTQMLPWRGIWAAEDEIMLMLSAQQALYSMIRLLDGTDTMFGFGGSGSSGAGTWHSCA